MKEYLCTTTGIIGALITSAFGGWTAAMTTLLIFMTVDYISGLIVAGVFKKSSKTENGALESRTGWKGLCKKGMTLLFVLVAYRLDVTIKTNYIKDAVCIGFIANELISIVENAGLMGIPLPTVISKAIEILKKVEDETGSVSVKTVDVKSTIRDISKLNALVAIQLEAALEDIKSKGINPLIVETYRYKERQYYLYGQGRSYNTCVNAGMPKKYAKKYADASKAKVTWTLSSIHIKKCAVDIIPQRNKKAIWNANDKETQQIINIMQKFGFEAGANWKYSPDSPHFQVTGISKNSKYFNASNSNKYVTTMIQKALRNARFYNKEYAIDGNWGKATDNAIKKWKRSLKWKANTKIGTTALKKLLTYL